MRIFVSTMFALSLLAAPAMVTTASADSMKNCAATWKGMSAPDKAKTTYKAFSSSCLKGGTGSATAAAAPAPAPAAMATPAKPTAATAAPAAMAAVGPVPAGATGQCKDGTYTMSKTHSGACSHHKGVAKWL